MQRKYHTINSVAQNGYTPMTRREIQRVSRRIAKVLTAAGLDASIVESRKSASTYVRVEHPSNESLGTVTVRVSDHYYPDRYADLERETDYQVFTSGAQGLVKILQGVMRRFGVENQDLLTAMVHRSQAAKQRAAGTKRRSSNEILADMISEYAGKILRALETGKAVVERVKDRRGDPYHRLRIQGKDPGASLVVAHNTGTPWSWSDYWAARPSFLVYGKLRYVWVRAPLRGSIVRTPKRGGGYRHIYIPDEAGPESIVLTIAEKLRQLAGEVRAEKRAVPDGFLLRTFG